MAVLGSGVSTVKAAIYAGLKSALGEDAAVLYDEPDNPMAILSGKDEQVMVFFGPEIEVDRTVNVMGGTVIRVDEVAELAIVCQVLDAMRDGPAAELDPVARQARVDVRLDELLGAVMSWLNDSANWPRTAGSSSEVSVWSLALVDSLSTRRCGRLGETEGRAASDVLRVRVTSRREPVS